MEVLRTAFLTHHYGRRRGISDVNLVLRQGEIFGFLGPNGAGKTTTIRVLLGFLRAQHGSASILGKDCWLQSAAIKQDVGYVAGDVRLYPWLTTRRALNIIGKIRGLNLFPEGTRLAERFRLELDLPVRKMSRGNRQKVALVLALAHRPRLVILDEPTSGLDPLMQETLCQCLREMSDEGRTVFFSSHTLSEVELLCHRVAMVRDGQIVLDESITSLKERAPRSVRITLGSEQESMLRNGMLRWPDYLRNGIRQGMNWQFELTGSAAQLVDWAAAQKFQDITIGPPGLDVLFHSMYQTVGSPLVVGEPNPESHGTEA